MERFVLINSSAQSARSSGELSGAGTLAGRAHPVNDTRLASCGIAEGLPSATLNTKDHSDFAVNHGLTVITD